MRRRLVALFAVALIGAAACGESAESDDPEPPPRGDDGAAATTVRATDFAFDPTLIEADPGEEVAVTLVNAGNVAHSFTADDVGVDVEAESGDEADASFTAPDEDASIQFVCRFHPSQMTGEIVVGDGGGGSSGGGGSEPESDGYDY
jgi:plastocyanin